MLRRKWLVGLAAAVISAVLSGGILAGVNQDCVNNGVQGSPFPAGAGTVTVTGGQVAGAGATLFVDFFRAPASTNDWNDVDLDGQAGNFSTFPFVDNLGTLWPPNGIISTHWMFQYRSVGSVNGFNEFVESQTCHAIPLSVPAEAGIFNQFEFATLGATQWGGPFANTSGTPVQPCEIEFSFLDVPSAWAVQVPPVLPANVNWDAEPGSAGYGLNPISSNTGYISNLQPLGRDCGSCAVSSDACTEQKHCAAGNCVTNGRCTVALTLCGSDADCPPGEACDSPVPTPTATVCRTDLQCTAGTCSVTPNACRSDADCPVTETCSNPPPRTCENLEACVLSGTVESLNVNFATPDDDTIRDFIGAWVPVAYIANRGTGLQNVKYSQMQYLFATGRMPNGENLVAATRSVGSGTRNAIMNSTGIDTSWARGDNVGNESATAANFNVGVGTQQTNCQGSGNVEQVVESWRLGLGYTGLAGPSRAASDAQAGRYEVLNICKDVDSDGNALCDCTAQVCPAGALRCSISQTPCTTNADCNPTATNGTCVAIDSARPNNGYVRPGISTVLDNCNECCGYTIGGNGSFVVRGNRHANRGVLDPKFVAGNPLDNQAVADYLNNIDDSIDAFAGNVFAGECNSSEVCTGKRCSVTLAPCTGTGQGTCPAANVCSFVNCVQDADCIALSLGTCDLLRPCASDAACTTRTCSETGLVCTVPTAPTDCPNLPQTCVNGPGGNCSIDASACDIDADCNDIVQTCRADFCKSKLNMPGQYLATTFFLPAGIDCQQSVTDGMEFSPTNPLNQTLENFIRTNNGLGIGQDTPAYGAINPAGRVPVRNALATRHSDGSTTGSYIYWNGASFVTNFAAGQRLSIRNRITGDFNEDGVRDIGDAAEMVKAYYIPRNWQQTDPQAQGTGVGADLGNQAADKFIPEIGGDFNGDGSFTKEDLRYWADGLAMVGGQLDRKQGAIAIDNAIIARGEPIPWADPARNLLIPPIPPADPTFITPKDVNLVGDEFLATSAAYEPGDFRGDVAGQSPAPGAQPLGWDGKVDAQDINYCARLQGNWSSLDEAVVMDLSCDMNGDVAVDIYDIEELVYEILETQFGDLDLDGVVTQAEMDTMCANCGQPCIDAGYCPALPPVAAFCGGPCGWADGDFNGDFAVDDRDFKLMRCRSTVPAPANTITVVAKTRALSFRVPGGATDNAIRVTFVNLPGAHASLNTHSMYVQTPESICETSGIRDGAACAANYQAATLGCNPVRLAWGLIGDIHLYDENIVPGGLYRIQVEREVCEFSATPTLSTNLDLTTSRWGDIAGPFVAGEYTPPNGSVDVTIDVTADLSKFANRGGSPKKARADLEPNMLDQKINISDVTQCLNAFRNIAYPFPPGPTCGPPSEADRVAGVE